VAAGHPATAAAAAAVLEAGGNAFDAALGALCAACVAEPVLASLGGGGFLLAWPAHGEAQVYDFFAQTPGRRRDSAEVDFRPVMVNFGVAQQEFHIGLGAAAVPGVVKGLFAIHRDLCRLPLQVVIAPAVELARAGPGVSLTLVPTITNELFDLKSYVEEIKQERNLSTFEGVELESVTGVVTLFDRFHIAPRGAADIVLKPAQ
jgi:gamma-glutamyltranspeptidase